MLIFKTAERGRPHYTTENSLHNTSWFPREFHDVCNRLHNPSPKKYFLYVVILVPTVKPILTSTYCSEGKHPLRTFCAPQGEATHFLYCSLLSEPACECFQSANPLPRAGWQPGRHWLNIAQAKFLQPAFLCNVLRLLREMSCSRREVESEKWFVSDRVGLKNMKRMWLYQLLHTLAIVLGSPVKCTSGCISRCTSKCGVHCGDHPSVVSEWPSGPIHLDVDFSAVVEFRCSLSLTVKPSACPRTTATKT